MPAAERPEKFQTLLSEPGIFPADEVRRRLSKEVMVGLTETERAWVLDGIARLTSKSGSTR